MAGWDVSPALFINEVLGGIEERRNQVTIYALQQLIVRSPVDTGAYRSNHRISEDARDEGYDPERTVNDVMSRGQSFLETLGSPYTKIFITNNLPYAPRLEAGSSQQAPGGIYSVTFNDVKERFGS